MYLILIILVFLERSRVNIKLIGITYRSFRFIRYGKYIGKNGRIISDF
jgi:hypothetical protein